MAHVVTLPFPEVEPAAKPPGDLQQIPTNPREFGAGIAAGTEQLGAGISKAGQFYSEVAADDSTNKWQEDVNKLLYGDSSKPGDRGFYGLQGEDAMRAMPDVQKKIGALRDQYRQGLVSAAEQLEFDRNTRRYQNFLYGEVGRHYEQQFNSYTTEVNKSAGDLALHGISGHANDPEAVQNYTGDLVKAYIRQAQSKYGQNPGADVINDAMSRARSDAVTQQVRALARTDPARAFAVLNESGDALLGPARDALTKELEGPADAMIAQRALNEARGSRGGAVSGGGQNNPGNIRVPGSTGTGPQAFQSFASPEEGVAAIRSNLTAYQDQHGIDTVRGVISRWAPPNENPTDKLIANASQRTGFGPDEKIDLHDPATMTKMVSAIVTQEQGPAGSKAFRLVSNAPAGPHAPGVADIADAQSNLAMHYAHDIASINANPALADNPRALQMALQKAELDYRSHEMALTGNMKALTEKRNAAADGYVQRMMKGPIDAGIINDIANDKSLDASTRENLWRVYDAHTKSETGGDLAKFGPQFYDYYKRVTAADDDPNRLSDPSQVYALAVPKADGSQDLTLAGAEKLTALMKRSHEPERVGDTKLQTGALAYAKRQLSFEADYGVFKLRDPKGEDQFNVGFMPAFMNYWERGLASGKTAAELVDKAQLDKLIAPYKRSSQDEMKDRLEAGSDAPASPGAKAAPPKELGAMSPQEMVAAVRANPALRPEAEALALKNGWIKAAPAPPIATPQAGPQGSATGLLEPGNIDLAHRPVVKNSDGTISTVRSMSFEENGKEVLVPTVSSDGKILSEKDAIAEYHRTGQFLGKFDNPKNATDYAKKLHETQARYYEQQR